MDEKNIILFFIPVLSVLPFGGLFLKELHFDHSKRKVFSGLLLFLSGGMAGARKILGTGELWNLAVFNPSDLEPSFTRICCITV